jgi:hypothetical protein
MKSYSIIGSSDKCGFAHFGKYEKEVGRRRVS